MDSFVFILIILVILALLAPIGVVYLLLTTGKKHRDLQWQIDRLQQRIAELEPADAAEHPASGAASTRSDTEATPAWQPATMPDAAEPPVSEPEPEPISATNIDEETPGQAETVAASTPSAAARVESQHSPRTRNIVDHAEGYLRKGGDLIVSYFTDGNLFVRIGLLVLFCGVAFLLKFAAESNVIPLEFRYMGAALGGIGLMLFGWRLRHRKPVYALLLQGGGVGITYITIFAAFRISDLIPPTLTFALLVLFAALTVALAVLQNSRSLAIFALIGGFLAPFLASTGSGNYIGLFSYYAVLNAAVFGIAWFRAWRVLNLLGFAFTFGVLVLWVGFGYNNADLYPTLGFVGLFFLMYSLIGVLYALRQPHNMSGLVDGTLVFGTPVIVSGLLMALLGDFEFGIAGATAGMGLYYLILARYAWRHVGDDFRLLAEAMLAIGVVFATLAIPYALEGHWSSAAWALEAAGILWVSIRQKRFYAQCFAVALQVGAGILFLLRNAGDIGVEPWLNPAFLGGVFIALGAFISARMLYLQNPDFRLRVLHLPFFVWAMGWWLGSALVQIDAHIDHRISAVLILFGGSAALLTYLDRVRRWHWSPASVSAGLLLPALVMLALLSAWQHAHILILPDAWLWAAAIATNYWIITRLEPLDWPRLIRNGLHVALLVFVSLLLSSEIVWMIREYLLGYGEGYHALMAAVPMLAIFAAQKSWFPAIRRLGPDLQWGMVASLSILLMLWSLITNFSNSGDPAPLPYIPFLNPVDLTQVIFFMLMLGSLKLIGEHRDDQRHQVMIVVAALIFVWITAVLIRSLHHYQGIPFDLHSILPNTRVHSAISILWTVIGIGTMWFASRRGLRPLWIAGAGLVGVVLIKMFFVDLGASGTVERIVSFLVVGCLLVATGYFSPIPSRSDDHEPERSEASHA